MITRTMPGSVGARTARPTRRRLLLAGPTVAALAALVAILIAVVPAAADDGTVLPAVAATTPAPTPTPLPKGNAPGIDGIIRPASLAFRTPLAVMVDDSQAARPQAGFNAAALVYQGPAEGGETRYMMIFQATDAKTIGPVRSGRPFFVRWAAEYRAGFAHYGGDGYTRIRVIPSLNGKLIFNLDAMAGSARAFWRVKTRPMPHNAYTSTARLRSMLAKKHYPARQAPGFDVRAYVADAPVTSRPKTSTITVPYKRGAIAYTYDRNRNLYLRSEGGRPQIDAGDHRRVTTRNVVVLFQKLTYDCRTERHYCRPVVADYGQGTAWVFREGRVWKGTWKKPTIASMTRFFDAQGNEIPLVRGRTFIQSVAIGTKVTYKAAPGVPTVPPIPTPKSSITALPSVVSNTAIPLTWHAVATTFPVASYDVRFRKARWNGGFGAYIAVQNATTLTTTTVAVAQGYTYCFSARARDTKGTVSAWTAETCTAIPLDDRALSRSKGWALKTGTGYYDSTYLVSKSNGAKLVRKGVVARRISILATTCKTCGTIKVYWNKTLLRTISLKSATTVNMRVFSVKTFKTAQKGTLTIKVSSKGKRVIIDGVAIRRT